MIVNVALTELFSLLHIENYSLDSSYSYILNQGVGIYIYIRNDIKYITLDVSQNRVEKYIELCAVQIDTKSSHIVIICIYKSTQGSTANFLICGYININDLLDNFRKTTDCIVAYIQFVSYYIFSYQNF